MFHLLAAASPCEFKPMIAEFLMSGTMKGLASQASTIAGNVGGYAAGFAASGIALYSIMWVVAFVSGSQNGDVISFIKWFARAMVLIALAGTASVYNEYVMSTFWDTPAEVAQFVVSSGMTDSDISLDANGRVNIGTALDGAAVQGVCSAVTLWQSTSAWEIDKSIGFYLTGLLIVIGTVIFVAVAAGLCFVGYASLAIVLALGPLFIIAGIWDATKPMMESWLRTAINYSLYGVVLMAVVGLSIGLIGEFSKSSMGAITESTVENISESLGLVVRSLFAFAIATALLLKADDISASLVGGISLGAAGSLGRAAKMAASPAKAAMKAAKVASNPGKAMGEFLGGSFHRDPRSGKVGYKGPLRDAKDHISALTHTRAKNKIRPQG